VSQLITHSSIALLQFAFPLCNEQNLLCDAEWSMEHLNTLQKILVSQQILSFKVFGGTPSQASQRTESESESVSQKKDNEIWLCQKRFLP
jgi:hypothetical protein